MSMFDILVDHVEAANMTFPCGGINSDGEHFILERGRDDAGEYVQMHTAQNNDWMRINTYYQDGTQTETFDR